MGKVAYTVGRFQPPTIGHKALIQAVKDTAGPDGTSYVFVSSTMSPKAKNPLTSAQKLPILQTMFPRGVVFVDTQECKDRGEPCGGALAAFYYLLNTKKHARDDIVLVVGDDRKQDFGPNADIWKLREEKGVYGPGGFVFLKSAKRNPDLEVKDAANMSGTKAREYVKRGRRTDFYSAIGYDTVSNKSAADAVYDIIKGSQTGRSQGGTNGDLETLYGADAEYTYSAGRQKTRRRKIRRSRASNKA